MTTVRVDGLSHYLPHAYPYGDAGWWREQVSLRWPDWRHFEVYYNDRPICGASR